jgi:DNA-binding LacI/PurR family transcriptional regulator
VGLLVEAEHTIRLGDPLLRAHPVLAVDQDATAYGINSVAFGNTQAGAMVAQHLLELGHRRFAITDDFIDAGYPSDPAKLARRHGFEAAIGEAGGVLLPEWRLPAPRRASASLRHQLVKRTVAAWAAAPQNKRPTALFAFDHLPMTQGKLVEELAKSGLQVPGDLSIVAATWAGRFFGGVAPETGGVRFSSIDFDLDGLVRKVFEAVAELAQAEWAEYSRRPPKVFVVPAMFIRGRSTAPPKALSKL